MKKNFMLSLAMVAALSLGACETLQNNGTKQTIGTATGAVIGGVLGSNVGDGKGQLVAVGVGTLLGALVGSEIGKSLDRADMMYAQRANQQAYSSPLGQQISWNNPESGNSGYVTPVRDGYTNSGNYCREFEQTIYVDGRAETGKGVACKQSDGTWKITN